MSTESDSLSPRPTPFHFNGQEYAVYPMPDSVLMHLVDELPGIASLFDNLDHLGGMNARELLPIAPQLVRLLLPNASHLIAGCLRINERVVQEEMPIAKKLEALRLIVEAENIPAMLNDFSFLVAAFRPADAEGARPSIAQTPVPTPAPSVAPTE